jgi:hypothetical protein
MAEERYTARDGINIARFAMKLEFDGRTGGTELIRTAILQTLGEEALRYTPR